MSCPAMCIWEDTGDPFTWEDCEVHFLTGVKKTVGITANITGTLLHEWSTQEERFDSISDHFTSLLRPSDFVLMEGYSYGSKGAVFHIGEHTGLLKHKLWKMGIEFEVTPPSAIKKFATGKGNANKVAMHDSFVKKTNVNLRDLFGMTESQESPSSDIADAFFTCELARHKKIILERS